MKAKDKERRIKYLMTKLQFRPKCKLPTAELREAKLQILLKNKTIELEQFLGVSPKSQEHKDRKEVFDYHYSNGLSDEEIMNIWISSYKNNWSRKRFENIMPKTERKDNQNPVTNTINWGSGGGHGSRIRVPSKKHKNRYKNFLKLFPNFENKDKI
jgi:hypothetical protein